MNISYYGLSERNARNKNTVDSNDYVRILAREGDFFRVEYKGRTKPISMAEIIQMVACGYAFANISFMKPYMRY